MTTNAQVGHLWAAYNMGTTTKDSARSSNGNFHFAGDSIWSYSTRLAKFVTPEENPGARYVLRNVLSYSITTSGKHQPAIWQALHGLNIPTVDAFMFEWFNREPRKLAVTLLEEAEELQTKAKRARTNREWLLKQAEAKIASATFLGTAHGFPFEDATELLATIRRERAEAMHAEDVRKFFEAPLRAIAETMTGLAWLGGLEVTRGYGYRYGNINAPTLLRIRNFTVQTSRGAEFPLEHGLAVMGTLCKVSEITRQRGEPWQFGEHGPRLGHFRIDRIEADGTVVAGCHRVPEFAVRWAARSAAALSAPDLEHVSEAINAIRASMPLAAPNE